MSRDPTSPSKPLAVSTIVRGEVAPSDRNLLDVRESLPDDVLPDDSLVPEAWPELAEPAPVRVPAAPPALELPDTEGEVGVPSLRAPLLLPTHPRTTVRRRRQPDLGEAAPSPLARPPPGQPVEDPLRAAAVSPPRQPARSETLRVLYAPDVRSHYPPEALQAGLQGTVLVVLWIDESGVVRRVAVERSSGQASLDRAARGLALAHRFSPGSGWRRTRLPVTFRIPTPGE